MAMLITVTIGQTHKAWPYTVTREHKVINDRIADVPVAVFHVDGALSALDASRIADSRQIGSTGVFDRRLGDETLPFILRHKQIRDDQTDSTWSITGRCIDGRLKGKQLPPLPHGDFFAFTWLTFRPQTQIYNQP